MVCHLLPFAKVGQYCTQCLRNSTLLGDSSVVLRILAYQAA